MPRSVNHVASRAKRKRILKLTRGYYGARKNVWTVAKKKTETATDEETAAQVEKTVKAQPKVKAPKEYTGPKLEGED